MTQHRTLGVLLILALVTAPACGRAVSSADGSSAEGSSRPDPSTAAVGGSVASPAAAEPCVPAAPAVVPQTDATATQGDDGKSLCLRTGQRLGIFLTAQSLSGANWNPVHSADPALLRSVPNSSMTPPRGVTTGFFKALASGTTDLYSDDPTGAHWHVHVVVSN